MSILNKDIHNLNNIKDTNDSQANNIIKEEIFDKDKVYELNFIKLVIKDYSSIPRTERAKILRILLNVPFKIIDLENKFGYIIQAFQISPEPKNFDNSMQILLTEKTDICFYYLEYRLLFFFDLSQSMLLFDLRQKILNIQKIEKYLNLLLKHSAEYEEIFYNFDIEKIIYKPKIICTIACASNEEKFIFLKHSFILEKNKLEKFYLNEISNKINLILMKYHDNKKKPQSNDENTAQIEFLYKILENCLLTFNLMPSSGNRILFFLTDGNIYLHHLGKYNNILMQLNRADISIQIIDMFYRNNCYGLTSPKFINNIEIMKYLAKFTGGNYINENLFIELFFPKELDNDRENKNKKDRFFYPTLYPNILSYNLNIQKSKDLWNKRFNDVFDEKYLHCEHCAKGFELFLCKKIQVENNKKDKEEFVLYNKNKIEDLINKGISIKSIGLLCNYKKSVIIKELFESYKLNMSLALIIESRFRESFYFKKTKNKQKIKFICYLLPGIRIKYNLTKQNDSLFCRDFQVDILIKGEINKITQMKKDLYKNNGQNEKVELLLNFIKQVMCTDRIALFFSEIAHQENFLDKYFFKKNDNYLSKLSSLPVRNWHRYFNVMICEIFIINNSVKVTREFINNFLDSPTEAIKWNEEKKEYMKNKILQFCDDFKDDLNFGIKKISKEENKKNNLAHNGFLLIKFDMSYKNICIVYLGFFHCFLTIRNKYYNKFTEFISSNEKNESDFIMGFSNGKHLTYFLTRQNLNETNEKNNLNSDYKKFNRDLKSKVNILYANLKKVEDYKNIVNNIFTYNASKKLINDYLKKFPQFYEIKNDTDGSLKIKNIISQLILQRIKEKFRILNWDYNQIIFFTYFTDLIANLNLENSFLENISHNPLLNKIIVLYSIKIKGENFRKLVTKLIFEPNENLYILTNRDNEKNQGINEGKEKNYFLEIIKYYKQEEKEIKKKIKMNINSNEDDNNNDVILLSEIL